MKINYNKTRVISVVLVLSIITAWIYFDKTSSVAKTIGENIKSNFVFVNSEQASFSEQNEQEIREVTRNAVDRMYQLMPDLAPEINFTIRLIDRDLSMVYGATGRTDRKNEIEISLSAVYQGGISQAIKDGLAGTVFHELHHTVRGWTMYGNAFPQGIDTAAINEGLADVFAEIQIGRSMNTMSNDVDFHAWANEILALPKNANYGDWMGMHPDGREAVGYRTGAYLVRKALNNSGKDIITLSYYSIEDIYKISGY